jgi:stress-induced morphogen
LAKVMPGFAADRALKYDEARDLIAKIAHTFGGSCARVFASGWCARLRSRVRFEAGWEKFGMPMDARDIESMIKAAIPDADVTIRDLAGDGDHYAATVISESFRGKSRVQQHQIVYQSLQGQMGGVLHALALQTGVPD